MKQLKIALAIIFLLWVLSSVTLISLLGNALDGGC